jgi:hypothetical protein
MFMRTGRLFLTVILAGILVLAGCASQVQRVPPPYSKQEVLKIEQQKADAMAASPKERKDLVRQQLRVASMAIDVGDYALARKTLIDVTGFIQASNPQKDFAKRAEGATKLIGGKEESAYFRGDPYEQLFSYLYLGAMDFQAGDYQDAQSMFRSASLADEGSKLEGYKSDCYLAFLLEGIAARVKGDPDAADGAFKLAEKAFKFRQELPVIQQVFAAGGSQYRSKDGSKKDQEKFEALFELAVSQLPIALVVSNTPQETIGSAFEGAVAALGVNPSTLDKAAKKAYKDSPVAEVNKVYGNTKDAVADLNRLRAAVEAQLPGVDLAAIQAAEASFADVLQHCRDAKTNVFALQQTGAGPSKVRSGRYGEVLQFRSANDPVERMTAVFQPVGGGKPVFAVGMLGDSTDYQAMTRGGRYMDAILEGKAKFKSGMNTSADVSGTVALASLGAAGVLAMTNQGNQNNEAMVILLIIAVVGLAVREASLAIADASHPEADVRAWNELPGRLFFLSASLEPGEYEVQPSYYDYLARNVPARGPGGRIRVEAEKPQLYLLGSPWAANKGH